MSQRAPRRLPRTAAMTAQPVVEGATAKSARPEPVAASEVPFVDPKQRTTLSLVPNTSPKRRRPLVVMVSVLALLAFAVIVTLVLLNTSVAQRQYEMVSLRHQERELSQENQALLKEAQSLAAPQTLAKRAKELGLVAPAAPGLVDLEDGTISKEAESASKDAAAHADYASLPLPGENIRSKASDDAESARVAKANKEKEATAGSSSEAEAGEAKTESDAPQQSEPKESSKAPAAEETAREKGSDGRPVFEDKELNGGSIPAPSIKSPAN
ncbi:hypothetical protein GCM10009526_19590 [Glutamicibacter creatinolyticus]